MAPGRVLLMLLRLFAAVQVGVGLALWSGHGYSVVGMHRATGVLFVCLLWAIAGLALARRRQVPLATFAIAWGLGIAALGFSQQRLLPGDLHWIVRVIHLAIGMAAMPLAGALVAAERPVAARAGARAA
jgi:hypothetical protein